MRMAVGHVYLPQTTIAIPLLKPGVDNMAHHSPGLVPGIIRDC